MNTPKSLVDKCNIVAYKEGTSGLDILENMAISLKEVSKSIDKFMKIPPIPHSRDEVLEAIAKAHLSLLVLTARYGFSPDDYTKTCNKLFTDQPNYEELDF